MFRIIGFKAQKYSFKDKQGREVNTDGLRIFCNYEDNSITGLGCKDFYLSFNKLGDYRPSVGDVIVLEYNRYGNISDFHIIEKK